MYTRCSARKRIRQGIIITVTPACTAPQFTAPKRPHERQQRQDEHLERIGAVHARRFLDLLRHRIETVAHHEHRERQLQRDVDERESDERVLQVQRGQEQEDRCHDRLERDHDRGEHQQEAKALEGKPVTREAVALEQRHDGGEHRG